MAQPDSVRVRLAHDARRGQILKAAAELFGSRNFDDVSTTELASAAGVSRGLLSHYFATKRDLYLAVIEKVVDFPAIPNAPYFEGITADERIRASVVAWLDRVEHRSASWLTAVNIGASGRDLEAQALTRQRLTASSTRSSKSPDSHNALRGAKTCGRRFAATRRSRRRSRATGCSFPD